MKYQRKFSLKNCEKSRFAKNCDKYLLGKANKNALAVR